MGITFGRADLGMLDPRFGIGFIPQGIVALIGCAGGGAGGAGGAGGVGGAGGS